MVRLASVRRAIPKGMLRKVPDIVTAVSPSGSACWVERRTVKPKPKPKPNTHLKASAYMIADGSANTVHVERNNTRWSKRVSSLVDMKLKEANWPSDRLWHTQIYNVS